jgi:CheY-like chemotaxis protein
LPAALATVGVYPPERLTPAKPIRRREGSARHTTIIAMTAGPLEGDHARGVAAGMDDDLTSRSGQRCSA